MALILDTGVIYAYLDRRDSAHDACVSLLDQTTESLLVPAPVVPELDWLIDSRSLDPRAFTRFLVDVSNEAFEVADLEVSDYARIAELLTQYADTNIGFVDAAVFRPGRETKRTQSRKPRSKAFCLRPAKARRLSNPSSVGGSR